MKTEHPLPLSDDRNSLHEPEEADSQPQANGHGANQSEVESRENDSNEAFSNCNGKEQSVHAEISPAESAESSKNQPLRSRQVQSSQAACRSAEQSPENADVELATTAAKPRTEAAEKASSPSGQNTSAKEKQRLALQSAFEDLQGRAKQMEELLEDCNRMAADSQKKVIMLVAQRA